MLGESQYKLVKIKNRIKYATCYVMSRDYLKLSLAVFLKNILKAFAVY